MTIKTFTTKVKETEAYASLERIKVEAETAISGHALKEMTLSSYYDSLNNLWLRLKTEIMSEEIGTASRTLMYPNSWFQMFKYQYFPEFLLKFFPIKWKKKSWYIKKIAGYPKLQAIFPKEKQICRFIIYDK